MSQFQHILVPIDFSDSSQRALDVAVGLAQSENATLTLVHVYEFPNYPYPGLAFPAADLWTPVQQAAENALNQALAKLRERAPNANGILRVGDPAREILTAIEEQQADLVVMGTHGRRGVSRALAGSVAEKTVRHSPVPVLTVRARAESP
jgi:nucleotide-binding universal stress UspA family protein